MCLCMGSCFISRPPSLSYTGLSNVYILTAIIIIVNSFLKLLKVSLFVEMHVFHISSIVFFIFNINSAASKK